MIQDENKAIIIIGKPAWSNSLLAYNLAGEDHDNIVYGSRNTLDSVVRQAVAKPEKRVILCDDVSFKDLNDFKKAIGRSVTLKRKGRPDVTIAMFPKVIITMQSTRQDLEKQIPALDRYYAIIDLSAIPLRK